MYSHTCSYTGLQYLLHILQFLIGFHRGAGIPSLSGCSCRMCHCSWHETTVHIYLWYLCTFYTVIFYLCLFLLQVTQLFPFFEVAAKDPTMCARTRLSAHHLRTLRCTFENVGLVIWLLYSHIELVHVVQGTVPLHTNKLVRMSFSGSKILELILLAISTLQLGCSGYIVWSHF